MSSAEMLKDWAWLIAIGLAAVLVGLLLAIRRLQVHHARRRAALAVREDDEPSSETHVNFLRARRNFLILLAIVVAFLVTIEIWNLYYVLER